MLSNDQVTAFPSAPICATCGASLAPGPLGRHCPSCLLRLSVRNADRDGAVLTLADYELIEEIARGGMGVVYRARHRRLNRTAAVKVLATGPFASAEAHRRFRMEAEAAARLQHPGIVAIHDVGETDGLPWLAMDFVAGENLAELVREQPLPARQAAGYARAIAEAVQHAHDHGVLHRDLKPSNVLLDPDTGPRVTDFGIARCGAAAELTRTGEVLGSPGYAAPEQALAGVADARTDVYGLGALLYHLLTARPPFQAPTLDAILLQLREADPLPPRGLNPAVPRDLETICLRCLRKMPANRYATASEVADELGRFLQGEPIRARPISPLEKTLRWCRRRPAIAALLGLLALVATAAFGFIESARRSERDAKEKLREANTLLAESLDRTELDRAEDLFRAGDAADALTLLARVVKRNPVHPVAAPRLASALWHGAFALPLPPPWHAGGKVMRLQFLRDGRSLLVCTDKELATWDAAAGRRLLEFEHDGSPLFAAVLSPDQRTVVAWDQEPGTSAFIFDTATGRRLGPAIRHEMVLHGIAFPPDSARFITAESDGVARTFEARTARPAGELAAHPAGLWAAVFSPDGETIATGAGAAVRWWNARTLEPRFESTPFEAEVRIAKFSPDGRWLFTALADGRMRLLSATDGVPVGLPMRHEREARAATFSADGERLLTVSADHTARIWSVPGGEAIAPPLRHRDALNFAAFGADGTRVVTCSRDNTSRVWDAATGHALSQPLRHFEQPHVAAFTPDGATLYVSGADGIVQRWDLRAVSAGPHEPLRSKYAEFSADGSRIIAAVAEAEPFMWESATLRPLQMAGGMHDAGLARISRDGLRAAFATARDKENREDSAAGFVIIVPLDHATPAPTQRISHSGPIADICFTADGSRLATASGDQTARVWDCATGEPVTPAIPHGARVESVRFSHDGRTLLTATRVPGKSARLWNSATGKPLGHAMEHGDDVRTAEFSPDGALIATASDDNTARVWDARTGEPVSPPLRHGRTVVAASFSPGSDLVATASWDCTARVWNARTGAPLGHAMMHDDHLTDVRFSPDGRRVATASLDKTARLWDAVSGQPLTEPLRHTARVVQVRFHPDGQRLLASTTTGARIWEVPDFSTPPPAWLPQLAEAIAIAQLPSDPARLLPLFAHYEKTRREALATAHDSAYARLARRLFPANGEQPTPQEGSR